MVVSNETLNGPPFDTQSFGLKDNSNKTRPSTCNWAAESSIRPVKKHGKVYKSYLTTCPLSLPAARTKIDIPSSIHRNGSLVIEQEKTHFTTGCEIVGRCMHFFSWTWPFQRGMVLWGKLVLSSLMKVVFSRLITYQLFLKITLPFSKFNRYQCNSPCGTRVFPLFTHLSEPVRRTIHQSVRSLTQTLMSFYWCFLLLPRFLLQMWSPNGSKNCGSLGTPQSCSLVLSFHHIHSTGTKTDLREDTKTQDLLTKRKERVLTEAEGHILAKEIGAIGKVLLQLLISIRVPWMFCHGWHGSEGGVSVCCGLCAWAAWALKKEKVK